MNNPIRLVLGLVILLFAGIVVTKIIEGVFAFAFHLMIPVLIVAGAGYVLYNMFGPKALRGGRRFLP